ncbi:MAG: Rieske 2Fe-2S domain-containing protein [Gammaproteobacteria bacterium]|nr:Rieske 2Fe-2S domain-containing protein [Gammaproteobacteria bacterium]
MNDRKPYRTAICRLDELDDPGSRGVTMMHGSLLRDVFIIRQGDQVFAYLNSCPHTGGPLDWVPDQFLNLDKDCIQCATHDALFALHDGKCFSGPCAGASLTSVPVVIDAGEISLLVNDRWLAEN